MIDGESSARRPIGVYWNVPNEGILARGFYLHPLMVAPLRREVLPVGTIDQHYLFHSCPVRERVHVVSDSDELCLFELSHVEAAATEITSGGIPPWRAATVLSRCDSHQRLYWATPIRLHAHDIGAAWRSVEEESGRFVGGLARSASGFAARRRGCRQGGCSALLCSPRDPCEGFRGELYGQAAESCGVRAAPLCS